MSKARKILVSPGYGAGWTSWAGDDKASAIMLEWAPIIAALEAGEGPLEESHPAVVSMSAELKGMGIDYVCLLGLAGLQVHQVDGRVRINEYDGAESFEEEGEYEGWM